MSGQPRVLDRRVELPAGGGVRLDVYLSEHLGLFSRSQARGRVVEVLVNGAAARLGRRVRAGDILRVSYTDPPAVELQPEHIPLQVIFENEQVIVVDKPAGMVVHPGSGNRSGTFLNALLGHCQDLAGRFGADDARPGIVHRLDKDTSGILIAAKNPEAHAFLARQFHDRTVRKRYVAMTAGVPRPAEGTIEDRIARDPRHRKRFRSVATGGRSALTRYRVLRRFVVGANDAAGAAGTAAAAVGYALVLLAPRTGRTHQLRVHMKGIRAPILGDAIYGRKDPRFPDVGLMLHARSLSIVVPGESAPRTFSAPLPERFRQVARQLQSFSPRSGL